MAVMSESPVSQAPVSQAPVSQAPVTESRASASSVRNQPSAGRYRINPEHSTVTFATRHLFGLAPVRGTLALRDGTIGVADPVAGSTVQARVAASTFQSGNPVRDAAVLSSRLLNAGTYPALTFTSTDLLRDSGGESVGEPAGESGPWLLRGELEVRGVTRLVEARIDGVTVDPGGASFRASARISVDRYAFGITGFRGLAARRLTIDLSIVAERAAAQARAGQR
jgi:polyisoprenoid-binding protein YceI